VGDVKDERAGMSPTIADVARAARVSTATVSRVLNGSTEVNSDLADRVHKAVRDLSYRPSRIARSLRTQRTAVWAVIISDIRNPFFTEMVRGVEDIAYANGYSLVLCNAEEDAAKEASYIQLALAEHMAGVIVAPASSARTDLTPLLERGVSVVTVDRKLSGNRVVDRVLVDNRGGAEAAVSHLAESGCRRIACISGPPDVSTAAERLAGYKLGLRAHGIKGSAQLIGRGDFREEGGKAAMDTLLSLPTPPDAVFALNNLMTLGALTAIAERDLSVPGDIAVVGFDDPSWAALLRPPLTTVAQPTYDLGAETARMLLQRIGGYAGAARELVLSPSLCIRASSVPAQHRVLAHRPPRTPVS
jgi:LacI family transcriptional regulator, galactose operon repressor